MTQTKQINLSTKRVRQNQTTLSTKREHLACTFFFPRKSYNSVLNITMSYNSVLRSLSIIISSPNLPWFDIDLPSLSLLLSIPMTANPTRARTTIHWCHLYLPGPMIERTVELYSWRPERRCVVLVTILRSWTSQGCRKMSWCCACLVWRRLVSSTDSR